MFSHSLLTWLLAIATTLLWTSSALAQVDPQSRTLTADSVCPAQQDWCLTAIYDASNQAVNYTLIATGNLTGWRGGEDQPGTVR